MKNETTFKMQVKKGSVLVSAYRNDVKITEWISLSIKDACDAMEEILKEFESLEERAKTGD